MNQRRNRWHWLFDHPVLKTSIAVLALLVAVISFLFQFTPLGANIAHRFSEAPIATVTPSIGKSTLTSSSPTVLANAPTAQPTVPPTPTPTPISVPIPTPTPAPIPTPTPTPPPAPTTVLLCSADRQPPDAFTVLSGGFSGGSNNCDGLYPVATTPTQAQATWIFSFSPPQNASEITFAAYIPANTDGARVDYVLYDCNNVEVFDYANMSQVNEGAGEWRNLFTRPALCVGKIVVWSGTSLTNTLYVDAFQLTAS
jgi:hypothetical protein